MSTTAARVFESEASHWYSISGKPVHTVAKADGIGERPTTLRDAKIHGLLPSVSKIIKLLHRPQIESYKVESACLAVLTAPRLPTESLDAFVKRVLSQDRQQDEERDAAARRGREIHRVMQSLFSGERLHDEYLIEMEPWVRCAYEEIRKWGTPIHTEKILVGEGYAGTCDLILDAPSVEQGPCEIIFDFKSTKNIPKEPYLENRLQLSAYAEAWCSSTLKLRSKVRCANCFISTSVPGEFRIFEHTNWQDDYELGFDLLKQVWQHLNNHRP